MAYIVKSNKTVIDNDGKFPYVTPYGETNRYLSAYYNNLLNVGYTLSESEFVALDNFTNTLIENSLIDNVIEIIPLVGGTNLPAVLTKLKFINSLSMSAVNFTTANLDAKGLSYSEYKTSSANALEIGFTDLDIWNKYGGFGYSWYVKFNNTDERTSARTVFGVAATSADASANLIALNFIKNGSTQSRFMQSSPTNIVIANPEEPQLYSSFTKWNENHSATQRYTESNGLVLSNSTSALAINTPAANSSFNLGALKIATNPTLPSFGFHGKIRFGLFTDGSLSLVKLNILNTAVSTLVNGLGKDIF